MALVIQICAVNALRERPRRELARALPKAHGSTDVVDAEQIAKFVDHFRRRLRIALRGIGVWQAGAVASVLDGRPLETVADAEVGNLSLPRDLRGAHHPAGAAITEPARYENSVGVVEQRSA